MTEFTNHKIEYLVNANGNKIANCVVIRVNGQIYFWSYDTCCACVDEDGNLHRFTTWRTNTTSKQLNALFYQYHVKDIDSKKFYELPVEVLE